MSAMLGSREKFREPPKKVEFFWRARPWQIMICKRKKTTAFHPILIISGCTETDWITDQLNQHRSLRLKVKWTNALTFCIATLTVKLLPAWKKTKTSQVQKKKTDTELTLSQEGIIALILYLNDCGYSAKTQSNDLTAATFVKKADKLFNMAKRSVWNVMIRHVALMWNNEWGKGHPPF